MNFDYIFLAVIFFLGFLIIREDLKLKKIRNWVLLSGFLLGIALFCVGIIGGYVTMFYAGKVAINIILSSLVAFLIWQMGFWPAGDAKFFILLSFLLPLHYYGNSYLEFFPSFVLLFNIFISFLIFAVLKMMWHMFMDFSNLLQTRKNIMQIIREFFEEKQKNIVKIFTNKKELGKIFIKNIFQFMLAAIFYFILAKFFIQMQFDLPRAIIFFLIFKIILGCINSNLKKHTLKKIKVENLGIGDSLDGVSFLKLKGGQNIVKKIGKIHPDGLAKEQLDVLKTYFAENEVSEVIICKTIPFSIWMIVGAILTIIFSGIVRIGI